MLANLFFCYFSISFGLEESKYKVSLDPSFLVNLAVWPISCWPFRFFVSFSDIALAKDGKLNRKVFFGGLVFKPRLRGAYFQVQLNFNQ